MENSMWTIEKIKIKKNIIVNNFHLLTENQRLPNMLTNEIKKENFHLNLALKRLRSFAYL